MSLAERDKIILTIIFSIIGLIFLVLIICFLFWRLIYYYRSKIKHRDSIEENRSPYQRVQYQRSEKYLDIQNRNKTKKRSRRSNTNDSAITLSFNPPHLINQNVKNLEKLFHNESTLTANSWFYEETLPKKTCSYEPIYASSSTVLTSVSNLAGIPPQRTTEFEPIFHVKPSLKYSQSYRQTNNSIPCDYYRSLSSLEPIYIRTNKPSNASLIRKVHLAQLRDDTAILY